MQRTNAGKALDLPSPRSRVDARSIRLLGVLQRRRDVNEEKGAATGATILDDKVLGRFAGPFKGSDGSGDDGRAGTGELGGDKGDALDVLVSVFLGEAELCAIVVSPVLLS